MPSISLVLDGPEHLTPIPDGATVHHVTAHLEAALVLGGMSSGKPSVMLRVPLPDGSFAVVETSFAILESLYRGMLGRIEYLASHTKGSG